MFRVIRVGSSSRVASVTLSAPPSRNSCFSSVRLLLVAGLKGCVQDLEAVDVRRSWEASQLTVKYILAVLQAPLSPAKLPSASDMYTTKLEAVPSRCRQELLAGGQVVGAHDVPGVHRL